MCLLCPRLCLIDFPTITAVTNRWCRTCSSTNSESTFALRELGPLRFRKHRSSGKWVVSMVTSRASSLQLELKRHDDGWSTSQSCKTFPWCRMERSLWRRLAEFLPSKWRTAQMERRRRGSWMWRTVTAVFTMTQVRDGVGSQQLVETVFSWSLTLAVLTPHRSTLFHS